jgi:hypothetical protein
VEIELIHKRAAELVFLVESKNEKGVERIDNGRTPTTDKRNALKNR